MGANPAEFPGTNPATGWQYGDTSVAEDVSDIIYQITPEDTPVYNTTGDSRASNILHQWQTRALATRSILNAQVEGGVYTFTAQLNTPDARRGNYTQIFNKNVRVSETEAAVRHYAIDDYFQDQMLMRMAEIKTDIEHAGIDGTLTSGSSAQTARQMQGLINAIVSAVTTYTTLAAAATLLESGFNDLIQVCWSLGSKPRDWYGHGYMKRKISGYIANSTKYIAAEEQKLVNTISVYQSDFFVVTMHLCRDIPFQTGTYLNFSGYTGYGLLGLDTSMIKKAWLRPLTAERTPKVADSYDGIIKGELTMEWGHPNAHFYLKSSL